MLMGSWFRTHKRQVITHTSIVVGFVLFTVFAVEPLFDRLERVPGEAQLQQLQLPTETNDIHLGIDRITIDSHAIECEGWAFIEGHDADFGGSKTYIVLKSDRRTYIFDTAPRNRPDVAEAFEALNLNLDWSGFRVNIPVRKIGRGKYTVGLYITKGDIEALQYTGRVVEF